MPISSLRFHGVAVGIASAVLTLGPLAGVVAATGPGGLTNTPINASAALQLGELYKVLQGEARNGSANELPRGDGTANDVQQIVPPAVAQGEAVNGRLEALSSPKMSPTCNQFRTSATGARRVVGGVEYQSPHPGVLAPPSLTIGKRNTVDRGGSTLVTQPFFACSDPVDLSRRGVPAAHQSGSSACSRK